MAGGVVRAHCSTNEIQKYQGVIEDATDPWTYPIVWRKGRAFEGVPYRMEASNDWFPAKIRALQSELHGETACR